MSTELLRLRAQDLLENPTNRVPVALCLDASLSMQGDPMRELNGGVAAFFAALNDDPIAAASAEVAVVAFSEAAATIVDFQSLERTEPPTLETTGGMTNLGAGVSRCLDLLEARKAEYRRGGVDYFQPWLVVMTDGYPNVGDYDGPAAEVRRLEAEGKLTVFPIGIGADAGLDELAKLSGKKPPLKLKGLDFGAFFQWLSQSVVRVSQSRPGEKVTIDLDGLKGWAEL